MRTMERTAEMFGRAVLKQNVPLARALLDVARFRVMDDENERNEERSEG